VVALRCEIVMDAEEGVRCGAAVAGGWGLLLPGLAEERGLGTGTRRATEGEASISSVTNRVTERMWPCCGLGNWEAWPRTPSVLLRRTILGQ